ncbi:MAG: CRISPR-associated endonuclease Cas2 [Tissierellia bacterium]|nr:CRISPR-associated endonuclease Cas2 [Tissierellia bacterium]
MRVLVFFDLPTLTTQDRREYSKFRKHLVRNGFLMLQESVYCKLTLNATVSKGVIQQIKKNKPANGIVQILTLTEKQFAKIEMITGDFQSSTLNSDERLVIL